MRLRFAIVLGLCIIPCVGCTTHNPKQTAWRPEVKWNEPAMMVRSETSHAQPLRVGAGDALGQAIFAKQTVVVRSPRTQPSQFVTADGAIVLPE